MLKFIYFLISISIISSQILLLKPQNTSSLQVAIIMIQGAECPIQTYTNMFLKMQKQSPFSLWIALPSFPENMAVAEGDIKINQAIRELKNQGFTGVTRIFIAGHSLGGIMAQNQAFSLQYFAGIILLGSYIQRKNYMTLDKVNIPILTISGELDGLNKVIKLAQSYQVMYYRENLKYVNLLLQGANHGIYIQGYIPPLVRKLDFEAQITHEEAYVMLSDMFNSFMVIQLKAFYNSTSQIYLNAVAKIQYYQNRTKQLLNPFLTLLQLQGYPFIPNYQYNLTWINLQQNLIFGANDIKINYSTRRLGQLDFVQSKTHLQKVNDKEILINMTTHSTYTLQSSEGFNSEPITSQNVAIKMKSRQALKKIVNFTSNGSIEESCKNLNKISWETAINTLNQKSMDRYNKFGINVQFIDDEQKTTGSAWVSASVNYNFKENVWSIQSPRLQTSPDFLVPSLAGVFYCKLVSPARFGEWILIDSIRIMQKQKINLNREQ